MDSPLADAWDEQASLHDREVQAAQRTGHIEHEAKHKAIAETLRKCARQLRQSGADRSRGIQHGHGNTQINTF